MSKKDKDCYVWGNQYGYGIVIQGQLAEIVLECCEMLKITPQEFVVQAIESYVRKIDDLKKVGS